MLLLDCAYYTRMLGYHYYQNVDRFATFAHSLQSVIPARVTFACKRSGPGCSGNFISTGVLMGMKSGNFRGAGALLAIFANDPSASGGGGGAELRQHYTLIRTEQQVGSR